ncbi:integrator complex subunit 6-like [Tubulanus polymorphus]|uniref:integrator complex subunit 6-like n=1 Tax=Tubulanus polymorphus TaxID=672921 RepID=UPI003DA46F0B
MTIILFLLDTSASMNQRTYLGTSYLDTAKAAVETFMKFRARDQLNSRWDRYMLLTFEDPPLNVKAGWKESHAAFTNELKNLQAVGLTNLGASLKHAFDLLNVNRMQSGIDTYGQGRCPYFLEPAVIICITDGRKLTGMNGVQAELNLPMHTPVPGSELTKEPFRWDQRLFGLVLRIPAVPPPEVSMQQTFIPSAEDSPIDAMCEVTGGRSYLVTHQRQLLQCLESLVQKAQPGVVIHFEKMGPDPPSEGGMINQDSDVKENQDMNLLDVPQQTMIGDKTSSRCSTPTPTNTAWHSCRKLIYVQRSAVKGYAIGHWPIPESFWPDPNTHKLPPRNAHPCVRFSCTPCEPMATENFPFDKYQLEPSPLTQYILERRNPNMCWQVFMPNSSKISERGHAFGYLKASTDLCNVNLFVMPYNYNTLLPLLDELFSIHKCKPSPAWRQKFDNFLKSMPSYYAKTLKLALEKQGARNLVPDNLENNLSYSLISYLKKLKNQAKVEYDRIVSSVGQKINHSVEGIKVQSRGKTSILQRKDLLQIIQNGDVSMLRQEINEFSNFTLAITDPTIKPQVYRNPFDIPRHMLLDQIARMRANLLQPSPSGTKLVDDDQLHSIPVHEMGNYQEYLKNFVMPLREIDTQPVRQHMFGNPFKVNKNLMIDEADEAMLNPQKNKRTSNLDSGGSSPIPHKRKPGPLPKNFQWRPGSPFSTPPASPAPSVDLTSDDDLSDIGDNDNKMDVDDMSNHSNHLSPSDDPDVMLVIDEALAPSVNNRHDIQRQKLLVVQDHNTKVKIQVCKEIRKPGRKYDKVFDALELVQGTTEIRTAFVRDVIFEASRFKKHKLVELLKQYEKNVVRKTGQRRGGGGATVGENNERQNNNHLNNRAATTVLSPAR